MGQSYVSGRRAGDVIRMAPAGATLGSCSILSFGQRISPLHVSHVPGTVLGAGGHREKNRWSECMGK